MWCRIYSELPTAILKCEQWQKYQGLLNKKELLCPAHSEEIHQKRLSEAIM